MPRNHKFYATDPSIKIQSYLANTKPELERVAFIEASSILLRWNGLNPALMFFGTQLGTAKSYCRGIGNHSGEGANGLDLA